MLKVVIDNTPVYVPKNTTLLEACEKLGVYVPRFCYHERLKVAGNCRMCLLEVEKAPKPVISCAFPINTGMTVFTSSPLVRKARENIIEFLLVNHPYDCPVCDQGGECDLQEQTLKYGSDRSRFTELKRTVEDKNLGPIIKTIMTRCIHCTRCVRFLELVTGTEELGTTVRGQETEVGTYVRKEISTELAGNLIDLCPVGALTSKPYAFSARPWELKNISTIDVTDSIGAHLTVSVKEATIVRVTPLVCDEINEEWISDKARFSFDGLNAQRLDNAFFKPNKKEVRNLTWKEVVALLNNKLNQIETLQEEIAIVVGNQVDLESYYFLKLLNKQYQIPILNEDSNFNEEVSLIEFNRLNTPLAELSNADFFLGIGVNPRLEGALFNVRLRANFIQGKTMYHFLGWPEDLTYPHKNWDTTFQTLIRIAEGCHPVCVNLVTSKTPLAVSGMSIFTHKNKLTLQLIFNEIKKRSNFLSSEWLGFSFLPLTPNFLGKSWSTPLKTNLNLKKLKLLFLVNLDDPNFFIPQLNSSCLKVLITPIVLEQFLKDNTLLLPITTFFENTCDFLNLEGRCQHTQIVNKSSFKNVRNLQDFGKFFYQLIEFSERKEQVSTTEKTYSKEFKENFVYKDFSVVRSLIGSRNLTKKNMIQFNNQNLIKPTTVNFYKTNLISKNSVVMSACASHFSKNFLTFHLYKKENANN